MSDEAEDFRREITIDSDATFFDLHNAILESVDYTKDQMTSFFICADDWTRLAEITLVEMDTSSEEDNYIMEETLLSEALEDEKQKLMYVFEYLTERAFFMELTEIVPGKNQDKAICTKSEGNPPPQQSSFEDLDTSVSPVTGIEEDFYGNDEFNPEELDPDGFEGLTNSNPYDDSY